MRLPRPETGICGGFYRWTPLENRLAPVPTFIQLSAAPGGRRKRSAQPTFFKHPGTVRFGLASSRPLLIGSRACPLVLAGCWLRLARRKDVSNRQMEESMYQMLRAFAGKGLGAGLLLAILSLGSASSAAAQTAPSTATGVPIEWVPRADRANEAPISRVHYEVEVRQFNREPCEFEGGILTPGRVSTQDLIEQFLLGECNPEERFETIRAYCPGSPLKVIGGGVRVSNRRAATVVDSYPDENGVDAETGAWVVHIERRPVVDFEREEIAMPAVRVQVTAVCAEVRESERDSDGGGNN